jgi:hypothetical protein
VNYSLILPEKATTPHMAEVWEFAMDYRRRHYGATQFQLMFVSSNFTEQQRKETMRLFVEQLAPTLRTLLHPDWRPDRADPSGQPTRPDQTVQADSENAARRALSQGPLIARPGS